MSEEPDLGRSEPGTIGGAGVVLLAAGASARMGGLDKIFADLGGSPVLAHSLGVFQAFPAIERIVIVLSEANLQRARELVQSGGYTKVIEVCVGGARRQDSVAAGLKHLDGCDLVLIHDAARPLIDVEMVARGLAAAQRWGAAVPAIPVKDTIKVVEGGTVHRSLDRGSLVAVQTPQIFKSAIIKEAYARCGDDVTDDAMLVERLGYPVAIYEGSQDNLKITTSLDLAVARFLVGQREGGAVA
ncbi:MAG: 2-C-methyl-D-erythritol 4-phosphate cytidylyltransferase [Dehalococcoidia bacterium]|nr:2-C-methyl-D-erythritol 4-phosphate cytidylyltransferase [Dehalococcoidia bacterium]